MQVVGATDVVAGNDCDEGGGSVCAGLLQATESVARQRSCTAVTVATGLNASVDTLVCQSESLTT